MKIVHIIFSLKIGGAETMLVDIANQQVLDNHKLLIIIINDDIDPQVLNSFLPTIQICKANRNPGNKSPLSFLKILFKISLFSPTVIHCHNSSIISIIKWYPCKKVFTAHCFQSPSPDYEKYDAIVCISKEVLEHMYTLGLHHTLHLVQNGVPVSQIKSRQKPASSAQTFRIVSVGRLHKEKAHQIVITALSILKNTYGLSHIILHIYGEGATRPDLEKQINELSLENQVKLLGSQPRRVIFDNLKDYDLMVHPCINEGFGLTVAEGMAAGLPVLVSDSGGPSEIICNEKFGFTFKTGDAENCAQRIFCIINKNKKDLASLVEEGKKHIFDNYSVTKTARKYIKIYRQK